jgi:hypothetical protein
VASLFVLRLFVVRRSLWVVSRGSQSYAGL